VLVNNGICMERNSLKDSGSVCGHFLLCVFMCFSPINNAEGSLSAVHMFIIIREIIPSI